MVRPECFCFSRTHWNFSEQSENVQDILPILFRLRLASQQGYAPALTACVSCGKKEFDHAGFLVSEGTIVCPDCVSGRGNIVEISGKSLDVLRQVQEVSPLHWHFLTSGSSEEAGEVLLPAERRERESGGWLCAVSFGPDWGQGALPEKCDPEMPNTKKRSAVAVFSEGNTPSGECRYCHGGSMYFQDVILTLQRYWASRGCVVAQPMDIECGAGTFNPSTFLRVIGPEPWRVAYVEPSRRPTDGRYGENPESASALFPVSGHFEAFSRMRCAGSLPWQPSCTGDPSGRT